MGNWESRMGSPSTALAIFTWQKWPTITACRSWPATGHSSPSGKAPSLDFTGRDGSPLAPMTPFMSLIRVTPELLSSAPRSEEHTSELQSPDHLVCRLLLEKKKSNVK